MQYAQDDNRFDGLCTVTLQGGGVLVFALLGQMQALEDRGDDFIPVAYAGSSAGGLAAALLWAGLPAATIKDKLAEIARNPERLSKALGKGSASPQDAWSCDARLVMRVRERVGKMSRVSSFALSHSPNWWHQRWDPFRLILGLCSVLWSISPAYRAVFHGGLFDAGGLVDEIDDLLRERLQKLIEGSPRWNDENGWCREYLERVDLPAPGTMEFDRHRPRFIDFDLARNTFEAQPGAPALVLSATDVDNKELLFIDSERAAFEHLPVSAAIRATIAFPFVFQPQALEIVRDKKRDEGLATRQSGMQNREKDPAQRSVYISHERFVDGGVLANSPSWAIAEYLRQIMYGHTTSPPEPEKPVGIVRLSDNKDQPHYRELFLKKIDAGIRFDDFSAFPESVVNGEETDPEKDVAFPLRPFAFRPLLHISLTIIDDAEKNEPVDSFLQNMLLLVTNGVRSWFERRATRSGDRFFATRQLSSTLGWKHTILDFHHLRKQQKTPLSPSVVSNGDNAEDDPIETMFENARKEAEKRLQGLDFAIPRAMHEKVVSRTSEEKLSIEGLLKSCASLIKHAGCRDGLPDEGLSGVCRLLLVKGVHIREHAVHKFGLHAKVIPPYMPISIIEDECIEPEQIAFFSRRAVISKELNRSGPVIPIYKLLLPRGLSL